MGTDLILASPGRPAIIQQGSCTIYISVHDQFYRRRLKELKQLVLDCHPDRRWWTKRTVTNKTSRGVLYPVTAQDVRWLAQPSATGPFRGAMKLLTNFIEEENRYYKQFGLRPPRN